jgi:hypothetical protein
MKNDTLKALERLTARQGLPAWHEAAEVIRDAGDYSAILINVPHGRRGATSLTKRTIRRAALPSASRSGL